MIHVCNNYFIPHHASMKQTFSFILWPKWYQRCSYHLSMLGPFYINVCVILVKHEGPVQGDEFLHLYSYIRVNYNVCNKFTFQKLWNTKYEISPLWHSDDCAHFSSISGRILSLLGLTVCMLELGNRKINRYKQLTVVGRRRLTALPSTLPYSWRWKATYTMSMWTHQCIHATNLLPIGTYNYVKYTLILSQNSPLFVTAYFKQFPNIDIFSQFVWPCINDCVTDVVHMYIYLNVLFLKKIQMYLCCTITCFHVISISLISGGDHTCTHYFLWRLPLCTLLLCSMTHYDITMGHNISGDAPLCHLIGNDGARDIHCDVTMGNDVAICTSQCIMTLLWNSFAMYNYAKLWYCCFTSKLFEIVHINHLNQYPINSSME